LNDGTGTSRENGCECSCHTFMSGISVIEGLVKRQTLEKVEKEFQPGLKFQPGRKFQHNK